MTRESSLEEDVQALSEIQAKSAPKASWDAAMDNSRAAFPLERRVNSLNPRLRFLDIQARRFSLFDESGDSAPPRSRGFSWW